MPQPPWNVLAVFDNQHPETDFAYTTGLAALGHPELRIGAISEQHDTSWSLSPHDMQHILNRVAFELASGSPLPAAWDEKIDGGYTNISYRTITGAAAPALGTHQVAPGTPIVNIVWDIDRTTGLSLDRAAARLASARRLAEFNAETAARDELLDSDLSTTATDLAAEMPAMLAPWRDLIAAHRAALLSATSDLFTDAVCACLDLDRRHALVRGTQKAAASAYGLDDELAAVWQYATDDAYWVVDVFGDDPQVREAGMDLVVGWLMAAYANLVVGDLCPDDIQHGAYGWVWALTHPAAATARFDERVASGDRLPQIAAGRLGDNGADMYVRQCALLAAAGWGAPMLDQATGITQIAVVTDDR